VFDQSSSGYLAGGIIALKAPLKVRMVHILQYSQLWQRAQFITRCIAFIIVEMSVIVYQGEHL